MTSLSFFNIQTTQDPRKLSQAVIQIVDFLDMYQAELARVLNVQCSDIGELSSGKRCLQPETTEWKQALLFVRLYQILFERFDGDEPLIIHWLRADNKQLNKSPHLLIVDDNKLEEVVKFAETQ